MKVWGRIRKDNKTIAECVVTITPKSADEVSDWSEPIGMVCKELDLARPVILKKNIEDFHKFSNTFFKPGDFMEPVVFDKLEIELY